MHCGIYMYSSKYHVLKKNMVLSWHFGKYHGIFGKWFLNGTSKKTMKKHGSTMVPSFKKWEIFQIPFTEKSP